MTRVVALYTVTMSPDDEDLLRLLHQNLQQDEVSPHDRRYVPLHEHPASFGPDVIKELVRDVTWTAEGSVFFLSGLRGSGKSTQLLRLREFLAESGFAAVRLDAEDYLNLRQPVDVVEFLFFLVGGISDAIDEAGWLPASEPRSKGWTLLREWMEQLPKRIAVTPEAKVGVGLDTGILTGAVSLKAELRSDESFVAQLRSFLDGRLSELTSKANQVVGDLVAELRASWRETQGQDWKGLIVLVDSLDHVRGADFQEVRRALVELFDKQSATIKLASCRTVFIVPPWVHVDFAAVRKLANIKITEREALLSSSGKRAPFPDGYATLRAVLEHRCPPGTDLSQFLDEDAVNAIIRDSGGHLRDLLRLVRGASVATDSLPFSAESVERGRQEVRDGLLPIADDERACLRNVAVDHTLPLPTQDDWEALGGLLDRHLILGYKNGETWYDVHPLIALDVE